MSHGHNVLPYLDETRAFSLIGIGKQICVRETEASLTTDWRPEVHWNISWRTSWEGLNLPRDTEMHFCVCLRLRFILSEKGNLSFSLLAKCKLPPSLSKLFDQQNAKKKKKMSRIERGKGSLKESSLARILSTIEGQCTAKRIQYVSRSHPGVKAVEGAFTR